MGLSPNQDKGKPVRRRGATDEAEAEALYDADMDDLDGDDQDALKAKGSSLHEPGVMLPNRAPLRHAIYLIGSIVSMMFFCSSLFAYMTREDANMIFAKRSGPQYIFDMVQFAFTLVFVSIWV